HFLRNPPAPISAGPHGPKGSWPCGAGGGPPLVGHAGDQVGTAALLTSESGSASRTRSTTARALIRAIERRTSLPRLTATAATMRSSRRQKTTKLRSPG